MTNGIFELMRKREFWHSMALRIPLPIAFLVHFLTRLGYMLYRPGDENFQNDDPETLLNCPLLPSPSAGTYLSSDFGHVFSPDCDFEWDHRTKRRDRDHDEDDSKLRAKRSQYSSHWNRDAAQPGGEDEVLCESESNENHRHGDTDKVVEEECTVPVFERTSSSKSERTQPSFL